MKELDKVMGGKYRIPSATTDLRNKPSNEPCLLDEKIADDKGVKDTAERIIDGELFMLNGYKITFNSIIEESDLNISVDFINAARDLSRANHAADEVRAAKTIKRLVYSEVEKEAEDIYFSEKRNDI